MNKNLKLIGWVIAGNALDYKAPVLIGYVGGETGIRLESETDDQIIERLLRVLSKYFKKDIPQPESFFITRWHSDPFSRGSYSYYPVGSSPADRDILAGSVNKQIYFAGEATHHDYPATTHGAYLSGIREARRVLEDFSILGPR